MQSKKKHQKQNSGQIADRITAFLNMPECKAAFLVLVITLGICAANGVYPFGENCILHVDMYHQYCPFFTEFRRKLVSGDSLMYSWNVGLGSDFFSVFVYYLSSPLNWLLFLCPEKWIIEFMTLTILIKMALAAALFSYFLRKRYPGQDEMLLLVFSTAYALCGFMTAYNWDIMWLDSVALAPLILLGLYRLVKQGKAGMYYTTLALAILCNYYISIMICIFLVFDFAYLLFIEESKGNNGKGRAILQFAWYSLLAGGTGAVMILPEMLILSDSGSSSIRFPEKLEWYHNLLAQGARLAVGGKIYTGNDHWPNLYTGAFALLLFFLFLMDRRIRIRERAACAAFTVFLYVSFDLNILDWFWHGLHYPDSLPGRQSFLFAFLLLVVGYRAYRDRKVFSVVQILLAAAAALLLVICGSIFCPEEITERSAAVLTVLLIILYTVSLLWDSMSAMIKASFGTAVRDRIESCVRKGVYLFAVGELIFNMAVCGFHTTSRTRYVAKQEPYRELLAIAAADAAEEGNAAGEKVFYRVEDTERKCKNDDCYFGYPSATQFSSLMNIHISHFFQSLYMEGGKNFYCHNGAVPLTSAMLAVRYQFSDSPEEESSLRTLIGQSGDCYLYRNTYAVPLGYVLPENVITGWEEYEGKKLQSINQLARLLGAEEDLLTIAACSMDAAGGSTQIHIPADGYYYASCEKIKADSLTFAYESGRETSWSKTTHTYLFDIGACRRDEVVTVRNTAGEKIDFVLYRLNEEALETAYQRLRSSPLSLQELSSGALRGSVDMGEAGRLVLSIPAEKGWTMVVDGQTADIKAFDQAFISVSLPEGHHSIELTYETPGLRTGGLISLLCAMLALVSLAGSKSLASFRRIQ